ncbi:unnamed protein product, partial [Pylaiella littoralis]
MTGCAYGDRQPDFRFWRHCCIGGTGSWNRASVSAAAFFFLLTSAQTLAFLTTVSHSTAVSTCSSRCSATCYPLRRRIRVFSSGAAVDMAHSCVSAAAAAAAEPEAAATTPPTLVSGANDVETFFARYRVRARRESERAMSGITEGMFAVSFGEGLEDEEGRVAAAGSDLGGGRDSDGKKRLYGTALYIPGGGKSIRRQHHKTTSASEAWAAEANSVLVLEDLTSGGDLVGFCGAADPRLGSQAATTTTTISTNPTLDTHIFIRQGCEMDGSTASLLVRSLHGWIAGPAAAAAASEWIAARAAMTRNRRAGLAA